MNTRTLHRTLQLVSGILALHLAFELFIREQTPFGWVGNAAMALFSGYAFLRAELVSIESMATGTTDWQRRLGLLTYGAMMVANGIVQTAYYSQTTTPLLHSALGWWTVLVAVGVALQLAANLSGQQAVQAQAEAKATAERERQEATERRRLADERAERERRERVEREREEAARQERLRLAELEAEKAVILARLDAESRTRIAEAEANVERTKPSPRVQVERPAEVQPERVERIERDVQPERVERIERDVQPVQAERSKQELLNVLLGYLGEHPNASLNEAGQAIGRSKASVSGYVNELTEAGRLFKNGHGWEVRTAD
jgi:hypothetical protein